MNQTYSLDCCTSNTYVTTIPTPCWIEDNNKQEKAMYDCYGEKFDLNQHRIEHLSDRLSELHWKQRNALEKKYGLVDDTRPITFRELFARIKAGNYIVKDKELDRDWWYSMSNIRWRDPTIEEDRQGYEIAEKKLDKAYMDAKDIINIKDADAGLKAVQDFEAMSFN